MGARKYGISLQAFNSIAHVSFYLSYKQSSPLLTEKSTLLMNENERIDTPNKNLKRIGALKMKHALNHNKNKQRA